MKIDKFDQFRQWFNPILRRILGLELCRIRTDEGKPIGVGVRLWQH
jgi:hypothetical protein